MERKAIEFEGDSTTGDSIDFLFTGAVLRIQIDNPWAGDSERGFGETTSVDLPKDKIKELITWLQSL